MVEEAEAIFEHLIEDVHKGKEVLIQDGDPIVRLEPIYSRQKKSKKQI